MLTQKTAPFSDLSEQKSELILGIIDQVKEPLLNLYAIGEKYHFSHLKHLTRLCEYVLLAEPGSLLEYDFDDAKIKKTYENYIETKGTLTAADRSAISRSWQAALEGLDQFSSQLADVHEQFVFNFVFELILNFRGGSNFNFFHREKVLLFNAYNMFVVRGGSKQPLQITAKEDRYDLLKIVHLPVVVENEFELAE